MNDYIKTGRCAAVALCMTVMLNAPGIAFAGPGCMNDQRVYRGYYPYSPMPPQAAYWQERRYGYQSAPAAHPGWMAAPYYGPMHPRPRNPALSREPAAVASPVNAELTAAADSSKSAAETITVRVSGMRFEPANLTIKPGTTVKWVQSDRMPHTVTGKGNELRSNTLQMSQAYTYTFDQAGRFDYACDFHPSMQGVVTVKKSDLDT